MADMDELQKLLNERVLWLVEVARRARERAQEAEESEAGEEVKDR